MTKAEQKIGYSFNDVTLLEEALTHSSYANEKKTQSNERLEFLGDSVLSIIISDYIFRKLSGVNEGDLTKYRATLVCEHSLAEIAKKISLGSLIKLGRGEEMTGGRTRASIISDAFEAVLAAIYLDGGIGAARRWLLNLMEEAVEETLTGKNYDDYKTMLQELVQKGNSGKVTYRIIAETGLDHDKKFEVEVMIDGVVCNKGMGQSKKEAEQHAARIAYENIKKR
ncbi:MAG: ribonuclease III [Clostridia bacterium]